jgi:hypothetical protein
MLMPKANPLVVPVPKDTNFRIPEGKYRAKISNVRKGYIEKQSGTGELVRLLFEVQVPSLPKTLNLARAEFKLDLNSGSELRNVLTRLLGKDVLTEAGGGTFDLGQLTGRDVEIEIEHVITSRRDEYEYPLVKVCDIRSPGTLPLNEYKEANQ